MKKLRKKVKGGILSGAIQTMLQKVKRIGVKSIKVESKSER